MRELAPPAPEPVAGSQRWRGAVVVIRRRRGWELKGSAATPEAAFLGRRAVIKAIAAGSIFPPSLGSAFAAEGDPSAGLYPAKQNPRYTLDRPLTDEKLATTYN